ncbi:MAG: hypothetical protein RIQ70_195 [Bacteroidota bacterium]
METGWFVYITIISLVYSPPDWNDEKYIPGDVIQSGVMASSKGNTLAEMEENCHKGGQEMIDLLQSVGQDSVKVFYTCVELPKEIEKIQNTPEGDPV